MENEENLTRLTSKFQNEISDFKYTIQELEISKKELQNELNVLKSRQSDEDYVEELKLTVSQLRSRTEQAERKCTDLIGENERLKEDMSTVSCLLFPVEYSLQRDKIH